SPCKIHPSPCAPTPPSAVDAANGLHSPWSWSPSNTELQHKQDNSGQARLVTRTQHPCLQTSATAALRPTVSMTGPLASAHGERDEVPLPVANCNRKVGLRDRQTDPVS